MRRFVICLFTIYLSSCVLSETDEKVLKFVVDATSDLFSSASITAFVCIEKGDKVNWIKKLSDRHISSYFPDFNDENVDFRFISQEKHRHLFLLDLDCPESMEMLQRANETRMFIFPYKWLILTDQIDQPDNVTNSTEIALVENGALVDAKDSIDSTNEKLIEIFSDFPFWPDSNVVVAEGFRQDYVRIRSIYRPSPVRDFIVEDRGYWTEDKGIVLIGTQIASRRRWNIQKSPLKSCIVLIHPDSINYIMTGEYKHRDIITKCNFPWAVLLAEMMNATFSFVTTNTWGYLRPNGTWGGLTGYLERDEVHFGGTGSFILPARMNILEYIPLSSPTGVKFIFRRPPLSTVSNIFTLPFHRNVWIAVGCLIVIIVILLFLSMHWEYFLLSQRTDLAPGYEPSEPTISDDMLVIIGAIAQQGSWYEARVATTRIIVFLALIASVNLFAAYSANIVALIQSTSPSIKTLKDLLESPLELAAEDTVYSRYYFQAYTDPIRRGINAKLSPKGRKSKWISAEEGIAELRTGPVAFHVEVVYGFKLIQDTFKEDEKCGLETIEFFDSVEPHFTIRKHSPYGEIFKVAALKLLETGLRNRQIKRIYSKTPSCTGVPTFVSVGLAECYASFLTLGCGVLLALTIYIIETISSKMKHRKNR